MIDAVIEEKQEKLQEEPVEEPPALADEVVESEKLE